MSEVQYRYRGIKIVNNCTSLKQIVHNNYDWSVKLDHSVNLHDNGEQTTHQTNCNA